MDYKENIFADEGYYTGNENLKQAGQKYREKWDEHKKSVKSNKEQLTITPPGRNKKPAKANISIDRLSGLNLVNSEISAHILKAFNPHLHFRGSPNLFLLTLKSTQPYKLLAYRFCLGVCLSEPCYLSDHLESCTQGFN